MEEEKQENEVLDLDTQFIVLAVPQRTLEVEIAAKVWHDGKVIRVSRTMPYEEVREAFKDAEHNYIPEDAVFSLTDLGREYAERLIAEQRTKFDEALK